ncbi:MAG: Ig-like domain-containing protein [Clostridiales bacterium]|nr:Ig-like domain-containing protein [Clostridiales bacterium]
MTHRIKPRAARWVAFVLMLAMLMTSFQLIAAASDNKAAIIDDITITNRDGTPLESPVARDQEIRIEFFFSIPDDAGYAAGDQYVIELPEALYLSGYLELPLYDDYGELIARVTVDPDTHNLVITFTEYVEIYHDVSGSFYVEAAFDADAISGENPKYLEFYVDGQSDPIVVEVEFEEILPDMTKSGVYDASANTITWTVIINGDNILITDPVVTDVLPAGLSYVDGSQSVSPQGSLWDFSDTAGTLQWTYTGGETRESYTFTFETRVTDPAIFESEGKATLIENTATLDYGTDQQVDGSGDVEIVADFVEKNGVYDPETKTITWTIQVNNNYLPVADAVIVDLFGDGSGQAYVPGSAALDGAPIADSELTITENNGEIVELRYAFQTAITEAHTFTFQTQVLDPEYYFQNQTGTFTNQVRFTGTGVPGDAADDSSVVITSSILQKNGKSYDPANQTITWELVVNSNQIEIQNGQIHDQITDTAQEFVADSVCLDGVKAEARSSYSPIVPDTYYYDEATRTLYYNFADTITGTHTVTFQTRVTDTEVTANNAAKVYSNTAHLTGDNIFESQDTGNITYRSTVISKSGQGYDHAERRLNWQVVLNANNMALGRAVFTDTIPQGHDFVAGTLAVDGVLLGSGDYAYDADSRTLTVVFDPLDETKTITFQTEITDLSVFETNSTVPFQNDAGLSTEVGPDVDVSASIPVTSKAVEKSAQYTSGDDFITWNVIINRDALALDTIELTDVLEEGLALDTSSIALYRMTLNADGSLSEAEEVALTGDNISYDGETRTFVFRLEDAGAHPYLLTFVTDVVDAAQSPFTNSISLSGLGIENNVFSDTVNVSVSGGGGSGGGGLRSLTIYKVDAENTGKTLEGAAFNLLDQYGNVLQSAVSDETGAVTFSRIFKNDVPYAVVETAAPTGYVLSGAPVEILLQAGDGVTSIRIENQIIKGQVEITKLGEDGEALSGAVFELRRDGETSYVSAPTGADGTTVITDVEYGAYTLHETAAPKGHNLNTGVRTVEITQDGVTLYYTVENSKIRGHVEIQKLGESGEGLSGAVFELRRDGAVQYVSAPTDGDGKTAIADVAYGTYTLHETIAPEGYNLSGETHTVEITEHGAVLAYTFENTKIRGGVEVLKLGEDGEALSGAVFALRQGDETIAVSEPTDDTGKTGFTDVEYGAYTLHEITAPQGHNLSGLVQGVSVTEHGATLTYTFENAKIRGGVTVTKYGESDEPLEGAVFALWQDGEIRYTFAPTGTDGAAVLSGIPYGEYTLAELAAPEGYNLSPLSETVQITEEGAMLYYAWDNTRIRGGVEVTKVDEEGNPLSGAAFTLYRNGEVYDDAENPKTTDENGKLLFTGLPYGDYTLLETGAPEGYVSSGAEYPVSIREDGALISLRIANARIHGTLFIHKLDAETGALLSGAEFAVYDADQTLAAQGLTGEDGTVQFTLPYGSYTVSETRAPAGYAPDGTVYQIEITQDGQIIELNVENTPLPQDSAPVSGEPSPRLGGTALRGVLAAALLSAAALSGVLIWKKKQKK